MGKRKPPRLLVEERRRRIMEMLEGQERVTVDELVGRFLVSAVTIRGDLDALAGAGLLIRSHGGALKRDEAADDVPIAVKETQHHAEKVRIGQAAAQYDPGRRDDHARLGHDHRRDRPPDPRDAALRR